MENRLENRLENKKNTLRTNEIHDAPIVRIEGLNKWYGNLHVLKDISLEVRMGEVVVVIGASGS